MAGDRVELVLHKVQDIPGQEATETVPDFLINSDYIAIATIASPRNSPMRRYAVLSWTKVFAGDKGR